MIIEPFRPFLACEFRVKFATLPWERNRAAALRRQVFCEEQKIFLDDDRDAIDDIAIPLVALSSLAITHEDVVGTVRIHEESPDCGGDHALPFRNSTGRSGPLAPH